VPEGANQAEEARADWVRADPGVWTERMLNALQYGVKGGKWYSLMDKVYREATLRKGFERVAANSGAAGVDHVSVKAYGKRIEEEMPRLAEALRCQNYRPSAIRRTYIPKPGSREKRPLGIPTVRDRIVQGALRLVIEPIFERDFAEHSYGFRPGRSCKDALREVDRLLKDGYLYVVDADLRSYFDTIPHEQLLKRVEEKIADGRVLSLIQQFLTQGVMEAMREWTPEAGTPQGAVISPLLANIYLDPLDWQMAGRGRKMVRYADDLVILCRSAQEAEEALRELEQWVREAGLQLHEQKTCVVNLHEPGAGFTFLGYTFKRTIGKRRLCRFPGKKTLTKLRDRVRELTPRKSGCSLEETITHLNRSLRGWFQYYKHAHPSSFGELDSWIRMRLRSILRKRNHQRGRGRGADHQRWPNAYFSERGLFSLVAARAEASQSPRG
jgi:RNA-directed DNA polymerase